MSDSERVRALEEALRRIAEHTVISEGEYPDDNCDWHCVAELQAIAREALVVVGRSQEEERDLGGEQSSPELREWEQDVLLGLMGSASHAERNAAKRSFARLMKAFDRTTSSSAALREDRLAVLGSCIHGVDLDRDFCPHGCRV